MNIVFFGASVTEQREGYAHYFKLKDGGNNKCFKKGYGSRHLNDAGICYIDNVLEHNPNVCFIDWFSTGYVSNSISMYLDTITKKLMDKNSIIVFLLFDRLDINEKRLEMYDVVKKYASEYGHHYIELYNIPNIRDLLRDVVHTNENGSKYYAEKIYEYYEKHLKNAVPNYLKFPDENKYCHVKKKQINSKIYKYLMINGKNIEIIGIAQIIGPHTGVLEFNIDGNIYNYNLYDQWCYYNRKNIKINCYAECNIVFNVTQQPIDLSLFEGKNIDPNTTKYLDIQTIFYLGEIENISYE